jgi:hypothetical protein
MYNDRPGARSRCGIPPQCSTGQFNEAHGLWQIVVLQREELEFFCPTREMAFAALNEEFDPESGFPRTATIGPADA